MEKENGRIRKWNRIFAIPAVFLLVVFLATNLLSEQVDTGTPSLKPLNPQSAIQNPQLNKSEVLQKTKKFQMPFIANEGQVDEGVAFYAKTFGGTVFVTKNGEIVYALPKSGDVEDGETHRKAAKCAKERSEKHISHKDTKNTEEKIEGGMDFVVSAQSNDKHCLSVLPATTGHAGNGMAPVAPSLYGRPSPNSFTGWHCTTSLSRPPGSFRRGMNPRATCPAGVEGVDGNFDGFASSIRQSQDRLNPSYISLSSTQAGSGLQPEPSNLLNTGVCVIDTFSKCINTGVQVANLIPARMPFISHAIPCVFNAFAQRDTGYSNGRLG